MDLDDQQLRQKRDREERWPCWAFSILEGVDDPQGEFRIIRRISGERVQQEVAEDCCKAATKPKNSKKNRYNDVLPYDHTRVKLKVEENSDPSCSSSSSCPPPPSSSSSSEPSPPPSSSPPSSSPDSSPSSSSQPSPSPSPDPSSSDLSKSSSDSPSSSSPSSSPSPSPAPSPSSSPSSPSSSASSSASSCSCPSDPVSADYINASMIRGLLGYRYVATQAPLLNTVADFWQMVWEQNTHTVVMLTRFVEAGKAKAMRYWPSLRESFSLGANFEITLKNERMHPSQQICVRSIVLRRVAEGLLQTRMITHLHYTEWPDYGLPKSTDGIRTLVHLTDALTRDQRPAGRNSFHEEALPPIVVHCSAGIGRAGTFISIHQAVKQIEFRIERDLSQENGDDSSSLSSSPPSSSPPSSSSSPSSPQKQNSSSSPSSPPTSSHLLSPLPSPKKIMDLVLFMREQRRGMVQTKEQYSFIYRVAEDALESLLKNGTAVLNENWRSEGRAAAAFLNGDTDPEEHDMEVVSDDEPEISYSSVASEDEPEINYSSVPEVDDDECIYEETNLGKE